MKKIIKSIIIASTLGLFAAASAQAIEVRAWIIYFPNDPERVADNQAIIAAAIDYRQSGCPDQDLILAAYTDSIGSAGDNLHRSALYAQTVADELIGRGIPAEKISLRAMGESQLAVKTDDGVDEPLNRRVEIWFDEAYHWGECPR